MTHFTDSPMESMMSRIPRYRQEPEAPASTSAHPCAGCCYNRGNGCIGICYRELRGSTARQGRDNRDIAAVPHPDSPLQTHDSGRCTS